MEPTLTTLTVNQNTPEKRNTLKRSINSSTNGLSNSNKITSLMFSSRSPSPEETNHPSGHPQPKPNQVSRIVLRKLSMSPIKLYYRGSSKQVSTVLLYGIPIVSLYIEAQERLCLAQISNTLLKQFSYNEIHNRRVALGITCVQCTPVQLEILRRAGAMPVSSRRCGMITRREAERLCKSFLGDNSPPRLPDDFSFGVLHECAWGCRGAFLPSRYNSSRAKCIKCTFCGLFFSPNKFIFHSHRVSANDKYIQPDAANFNSWRRHLKLSGTPPDDVTHAWEDVKAMFNGGTRKRLMSSPMSSLRSHSSGDPPPSNNSSSKRSKDSPAIPTPTPPSNTPQFPVRTVNIHHPIQSNQQTSQQQQSPVLPTTTPTPVIPINNTVNSPVRATQPPTAFPPELPFSLSRSFMIDYMWHQHHQQTISSTTSTTSSSVPAPSNKANQFQFPPYSALSWIKQPPTSFLFKPNGNTIATGEEKQSFNHLSAFKPVINMRLDAIDTTGSINVNPNTQSPTSSTSSTYNHTTASSTTNQSGDEDQQNHSVTHFKKQHGNRKRDNRTKEISSYYVDDDENSNPNEEDPKIYVDSENGDCSDSVKGQLTSDDENEMVDIETTEDEVNIHNLQPYNKANGVFYGRDDEEELIEVAEEKLLDHEQNNNNNNNNLIEYESEEGSKVLIKRSKTPLKSLKEIIDRNDNDYEEYSVPKRITTSQRSPPFNEWTLNLKKEVSLFSKTVQIFSFFLCYGSDYFSTLF